MTTFVFLVPIANHLWQSTFVAAIAGVLTLMLRKNRARIRYWIWLTASIKFLVPFSFLIALGGMFPWPNARVSELRRLPVLVDEAAQPFVALPSHLGPSVRILDGSRLDSHVQESVAMVWLLGCAAVLLVWFRQWRRMRIILRDSIEATGRQLEIMRRLRRDTRLNLSLRLLTSSTRIEPGVVGVFRPVLVLPGGIGDQLTDAELEAVLAHELAHVRRRDNLFAGIHSIVEAIFWFYPAVWWIGRRLIAEREYACDEAVLRRGNHPETYAEGILKVCEFYVKAPLACASGVSASNLRKRIEAIVGRDVALDLNAAKRLMLAAAVILAIAAPFAIGMSRAARIGTQSGSATPLSFEVISIKPNNSRDRRTYGPRILPGGNVTATNITLWDLILGAYWIPNYLVSGAPDWTKSERFDIEAKVAPNVIPSGISDRTRNDYVRRMMQTMLAERFKVLVHRETKEMPVYELVIAKNGPKLTKAPDRDCSDSKCHMWGPGNPMMQGGFPGTSVDMDDLIDVMEKWLDHPAVNKTNIKGMFDIHLQFNPRPNAAPGGQRDDVPTSERVANADAASLPDIFTALQEQLGLKLESRKGQVETMVIDHVERPTTN